MLFNALMERYSALPEQRSNHGISQCLYVAGPDGAQHLLYTLSGKLSHERNSIIQLISSAYISH